MTRRIAASAAPAAFSLTRDHTTVALSHVHDHVLFDIERCPCT